MAKNTVHFLLVLVSMFVSMNTLAMSLSTCTPEKNELRSTVPEAVVFTSIGATFLNTIPFALDDKDINGDVGGHTAFALVTQISSFFLVYANGGCRISGTTKESTLSMEERTAIRSQWTTTIIISSAIEMGFDAGIDVLPKNWSSSNVTLS